MKIKILFTVIFLYIFFELGIFLYNYNNLPELAKILQPEKKFGQSYNTLRYIAAGDSTAVGVGASSVEKTYSYKLAVALSEKNTVEYKNIAVAGSKTQDILDNQVNEIIKFNPGIVTISVGANDATHLNSEKTILSNLRKTLDTLKQNTKAQIYLTNIPSFKKAEILPWFFIDLIEYRSSYINKKILNLEDERVKIVNIHEFGWSNFPDLRKTFAADKFHPNDIGYENWFQAFLEKITQDYNSKFK